MAGCFEDKEERSRIHAGIYIFETDIAQLVINRNCKKKKRFAALNLGEEGGLRPLRTSLNRCFAIYNDLIA